MKPEQSIRHALIMAAGRGNRMRPLSDFLPKAMLPYKGDTLIGNSLTMLSQCVSFVHVTVGYKRAMLSQYLMERGVDSILNTEGHSNGWWIGHTLLQYLNEPVLVLTTDNVTELDIDFLTSEYRRLSDPACMLVPVVPIPMIEGDYITHDSGVVRRVHREMPTDIYCSGIQVLNPAKVCSLLQNGSEAGAEASLPENFNAIWDNLIPLEQLKVSNIYPKAWFSIDTFEQLVTLTHENRNA